MKGLLFAVAAALLLAGCGTTGLGPAAVASPSPSATTSPATGFAATVTEKDQTVTLREGQRLLVLLHAVAKMRTWSHPQSSDLTVLRPMVDPAAMVPLGVTVGAFLAVKSGQAQVTSVSGPECPPGEVCPMYAIVYTLTVTVTP